MFFIRITLPVFIFTLNFSFTTFCMQQQLIAFPQDGILTKDFFYSIYPGGSKDTDSDGSKKLMVLGKNYFFITDGNNNIIKDCNTDRICIKHAFFSPSGQYILTTSSLIFGLDIVDLWDTECNHLLSITDPEHGIHIGIFGDDDQTIITNSENDNNLSKVWIW